MATTEAGKPAGNPTGEASGDEKLPTSRHCALCLKEYTGSRTCGKCRKRAYCSRECQIDDWTSDKGQGHKYWCKLECGEEDIDWKIQEIPGKGLGVVALRDIPAKTRIMVDRGFTEYEIKNRPQVMDLSPLDESFEKKFQVNQLATENVGPIVCLRLSRVNHACVANAAHWYEDEYKVKILFSEKDIKAGEEITYSYLTHRSVHLPYTQQSVQGNLLLSWGIVCSVDCACRDPSTWRKVKEIKTLNDSIPMRFDRGDISGVYRTSKQILALYDSLGVGLLARKGLYVELFQFCIMKSETFNEGLQYMKEALKIEECIEPYKKNSVIKRYIEAPFEHELYMAAAKFRGIIY